MTYIAYTTKGIEHIAEQEIKDKLNAEIVEVANKRILFETTASYEEIVQLTTIDDIGLLLAMKKNVTSIGGILEIVEDIRFDELQKTLATFRETENTTFSLTTSFARVKALNPQQVVSAVSEAILQKYGWKFTPLHHTNFDIRIFIDETTAYISLRLTKESLHHRIYKTHSASGTLRPTVAAAMVLLATKGRKHTKVVDNFCGSGTILAEAFRMGNEISGGDINSENVIIAKKNIHNLSSHQEKNIHLLDATNTAWPANTFDRAISNLPWDKQIVIKSITNLYEDTIKEYARILKTTGVLCVLVSKPELFIKYTKMYFPKKSISQYKLGLLGQTPTIILIH
jgi:23S rRNA G2445 N2-methylase RlmL